MGQCLFIKYLAVIVHISIVSVVPALTAKVEWEGRVQVGVGLVREAESKILLLKYNDVKFLLKVSVKKLYLTFNTLQLCYCKWTLLNTTAPDCHCCLLYLCKVASNAGGKNNGNLSIHVEVFLGFLVLKERRMLLLCLKANANWWPKPWSVPNLYLLLNHPTPPKEAPQGEEREETSKQLLYRHFWYS